MINTKIPGDVKSATCDACYQLNSDLYRELLYDNENQVSPQVNLKNKIKDMLKQFVNKEVQGTRLQKID